jgi:hypothetical protein
MTIITQEHRDFFRENGYVVIKNAVPRGNCDRVIEAIWLCLGKDPSNQEEWYTPPAGMDTFWEAQSAGMVEMFHHPSMWDNRSHPRLYQAFAELWNNENLWVSIDRVNMKPPAREEHRHLDHAFIHWDMDTSNLPSPLPHPMGVQGVLFLSDTEVDQGGFQCVPSIYRHLNEWIVSQPMDRNPRVPDITGHEIVKVTGEAGDLVIWDMLLPHGNGHNLSTKPRLAQYITMNPANPATSREAYIACWRSNRGRPNHTYDPRDWEHKTFKKPAELTPLGRKLLGVDSWFA